MRVVSMVGIDGASAQQERELANPILGRLWVERPRSRSEARE
jgi:hypothetical protein